MHFIDSFDGLSPPGVKDAIGERTDERGEKRLFTSHVRGHFAIDVEHVRAVLARFPDAAIHKGWIPGVLSDALPDTGWAFVHIDVDLYGPTMDCLRYFYPRLVPGGVIINDDFDSPLFPGAGAAWTEFCDANGLKFVALDSGQAVLTRPSTGSG